MSRQIEVGGALKCRPSTLGRAAMDADLDLLLIAVYCTVDDLLPERAENARRRITDQEVITLCIAQALLDCRSDDQFLAIAARRLVHLFAALPERSAFSQAPAAPVGGHRGPDRGVRPPQPPLLRRAGARRLHAGGVRAQPRDDTPQPTRRRRRLRLLRQPQPLLLGAFGCTRCSRWTAPRARSR
jgi:hypothetical protein